MQRKSLSREPDTAVLVKMNKQTNWKIHRRDNSMKKVLITGGTTFVSRFAAEYFVKHNYDVYVINRNTKSQVHGVTLIECDRHKLGDKLKGIHFNAVLDITAYDTNDILDLYNAIDSFEQYIMVSSSAVYPEYGIQPFLEDSKKAANKFWGDYGIKKYEAENILLEKVPDAYILRPPYLYGPMNNIYREAFVFDCAKADRKFYLPKDGSMKLQFFHVRDLCGLMETIMNEKPSEHIMNVGNIEPVTIREWVEKCYACFDKKPEFINVYDNIEQRNYFCFYNYEYYLDVHRQNEIYPETISLSEGLQEATKWYLAHEDKVNKKAYFDYIDGDICEAKNKY